MNLPHETFSKYFERSTRSGIWKRWRQNKAGTSRLLASGAIEEATLTKKSVLTEALTGYAELLDLNLSSVSTPYTSFNL